MRNIPEQDEKLKIIDLVWLIYELLVFPGYGILIYMVLLDYIPHEHYLEFLVITLLFALPRFIMSGALGDKPKKKLEDLLKLTI